MFGEFDEIAVGPDAREGVEVGVAVAFTLWVFPEAHGHGRQWLAADQLAAAFADRFTVIAVGHSINAQEATLNFSPTHRQQRGRTHEATADVGAPGDGAEQGSGGAIRVDPVIVFRQQW